MFFSANKMYNSNNTPAQSPVRLLSWGCGHVADWNYPASIMQTSFWRCYLNDRAVAHIWLGAKKFSLSDKQICLIAPDTAFSCANDQDFWQLYFHFNLEWTFTSKRNKVLFLPVWPEAKQFFSQMKRRGAGITQQHFLAGLGFLHSALGRLPAELFSGKPVLDSRLQGVIKMLDHPTIGHFSNSQLAQRAGMGENAFIRLFSSQIGKPPQQYYREKRIERACWLLNNSKASIEQIANETGFVDRYHFSKVFKTSTGETPASYRRLRQKGKA
mgnify:CR=1 FL=1